MLSALRARVNAQLSLLETQRKPALRRTDDPAALLMTDLPRIADAENVAAFVSKLEADGWRVWAVPGWLMLDHPVTVPETSWPAEYPGEWGCCVRLLQLHPGDAPAEAYIRALVKAADIGNNEVERLCRSWHGEFAERLREHRALPGALTPYLCAAMKEEAK